MTVFLSDLFTGSATALTSHTPDTGGAWVEMAFTQSGGSPSLSMVVNNDRLEAQSDNSTAQAVARNAADPGGAEYDVSISYTPQASSQANRTAAIYARMTPTGTAHADVDYYQFEFLATSGGGWRLNKNVSGTRTELDSLNETIAGSTWTITAEVRDASKRLLADSGGGAAEKITTADNEITQNGRVGVVVNRTIFGEHWLDTLSADSVAGAGGQTVEANLLDATGALFSPTVTVGAVTVEANLLDATGTVFTPSVETSTTVEAVLLDATGTLFQPSLAVGAVTVEVPLLDATGTVFQPAVATDAAVVEAPLLDATGTLFQPAVSPGTVTVEANLLDATGTVFSPEVTQVGPGAQAVSVPLLDATGTLFAPEVTVGGVQVAAVLLDATATLFQPDVTTSTSVAAPLLDATGTLFAPEVTVGAVSVAVPLLDGTATLFAPTVIFDQFVAAQLLDATGTVFSPAIAEGELGVVVAGPTRVTLTGTATRVSLTGTSTKVEVT